MVSLLERKLRRDIARRRWQFAAIVVTVALGVALFGASYDAYQNLLASYQELFDRTHFAALTIEGGNREDVAAAIRDEPGVEGVATRSTAELPIGVAEDRFIGRVVGLPVDRRPAVDDVLVLDGDYLAADDPAGVLVERHMADHFDLQPGDVLEIHGIEGWQSVTVRGVVASAEYIWPARSRQEVLTLPDDFGVVFAPQPFLDELPPQLTTQQVAVTYVGGGDDPAVTDALVARALAAGASDAFSRADQPSNAALQEDISGFGELSLLFPLMFLSAAALATYVLLSRTVLAQRPQIGLLLAVGFLRRRVFGHYLGFGVATGLVGAVIGVAVGLALAGLITRVYTGVIAIPITIVEVRAPTVVEGLLFGAVAGALAALVPAWRASRLSPAAAMAGTMPSSQGSESLPERAFGFIRRWPARWKMVIRGIGRAPVRSLSTVAGVMIAVTLVLVSWAMIDTIQVVLDRQFNQADRTDAVAYMAGGATPADLDALRGVPGVADAEPFASLGVTIDHGGERYSTSLAAFPAGTSMHRFLTETGTRRLPDSGILVGAALRDRIGLQVGDAVTLVFGSTGQSADAAVAGFVSEPLGTYAYASLQELSRLIGESATSQATVAVNVRFDAGADPALTRDRLASVRGVTAVTDTRRLEQVANDLMGLFYAFVGVMLVLGAVMAFALLFNLMSANIGERLTELASLRAAGMSGSQLSRIITAENLLLTLAGIIPGLVIGYAGAAAFMASFSSDLFQFDLHVRPTTFVLTAAAVLAAAVVSQLPILSAVQRIDIARVVRERAA